MWSRWGNSRIARKRFFGRTSLRMTRCAVNVILSVAKDLLPSLVREGGCGNATDERVVVQVFVINVLKLPLSQAYCLTAPKVMPQALLLTRGALFKVHYKDEVLSFAQNDRKRKDWVTFYVPTHFSCHSEGVKRPKNLGLI